MLRVTPIYGSRWSKEGQAEEPSCTLIEYGGCRVLWNCGWCAASSAAAITAATATKDEGITNSQEQTSHAHDAFIFPKELPDHECLIISDSTIQASGGLPLYYKTMLETKGYVPPIYATFPTVKMGQMTLYDQHASICFDGGRPPYSLEDIDNVYSSTTGVITAIKYSQSITVYQPQTGQSSLLITAQRAGHVVGGAFFTLQRIQDETMVVLTTSNYHIAKELHLDSSTLLKYGSTPDVLVTYPGGFAFRKLRALSHPGNNSLSLETKKTENKTPPALPPMLVTQAERNLVENVLSVLRRDGNVLLPVDAAGRVLELVLLLNQTWDKQRLSAAYNLCWIGPMVGNTIEFARSQLEWMSPSMGNQFDSPAGHPYFLRCVNICSSVQELTSIMEENQNPTCVLATGLSLDAGPSRDLLLKWADNPDNAIVFTDSSHCYLRRNVQHQRRRHEDGDVVMASDVTQADVPLDGNSQRGPPPAPDAIVNPVAPTAAENAAPGEEEEAGDGANLAFIGSAVEGEVSPWTVAGQLLLAWSKAKYEGKEMEDSVLVDVKVPHRAPLSGPELKAFLAREEQERLRQKKEEEEQAMLREVELAKGQLRLGEQDTSTAPSTSTALSSDSKTSNRPKKKSRFDSSLFLKFSKPLHRKSCRNLCLWDEFDLGKVWLTSLVSVLLIFSPLQSSLK